MASTVLEQDLSAQQFSIEEFLEQERNKDLLRFSTAGSVDDGKSTLIGRLLYDTRSVYDDQVRSIQGKGSAGEGQLDFALLTDGLRAEREQGITIDVAYRYFATSRRKFIIADTPGHEQYTRNMATGASTADAAIVLVDARKGVLIQSRRHAYITSLLGVRHIIVAVNKMDLVDYRESVFRSIQAEFEQFLRDIGSTQIELHFLPVSALLGVNVVHRSKETPWYHGPSLLELLETLPSAGGKDAAPFRFPVQRVLRPHQNFRGFAGQIASGKIRIGDRITVLPSGHSSRVDRIVTFDGDLDEARAPLSVTLTLEDELDISRGDLLTLAEDGASSTRRFTASVVWMDAQPLDPTRRYLLKHTSQAVPVQWIRVGHRIDVGTLAQEQASTLEMNGIGFVELETRRPISLDSYAENRVTGSFVLIDVETNATVGAGMVREILEDSAKSAEQGPVTAQERSAKWGHTGAVIHLSASATVLDAIERALFQLGAITVRSTQADAAFHSVCANAGFLVFAFEENDKDAATVQIGSAAVERHPENDASIVTAVLDRLRQANVLHSEEL
jgi:sulfate adenylyltransferase subunit 1